MIYQCIWSLNSNYRHSLVHRTSLSQALPNTSVCRGETLHMSQFQVSLSELVLVMWNELTDILAKISRLLLIRKMFSYVISVKLD